MKGLERFIWDGRLLALIVRAEFKSAGIEFFTDPESSQQLGYMNRPMGYEVAPHWHRKVDRRVQFTQEVLVIREGRCRLELFGEGKVPVVTTELKSGDIALLAEGGHSLTMLEQTEIVEIKQGPYLAEEDKVRFARRGMTQ